MFSVYSDKAFQQISQIESTNSWSLIFLELYFTIGDADIMELKYYSKANDVALFSNFKMTPKSNVWLVSISHIWSAQSDNPVKINLHALVL